MSTKREYGDGGLYWDQARQRWIVEVTLGYDGRGKRVRRRASAKTKTEAKRRLREIVREVQDGLAVSEQGITVSDSIDDFLRFEILSAVDKTQRNYDSMCRLHIVPHLGAYRLTDLTAGHLDRWLADLSSGLSTRSLRLTLSLLSRAIDRSMARDHIRRNVAKLIREVPPGRPGRPSKSLTMEQAQATLTHMRGSDFYPYFVVGLTTGARTEEMRPLTWKHTFLEPDDSTDPPTPPHIKVWRSVRIGNDTKTRRSRRTLALPDLCISVLMQQRGHLVQLREQAGDRWLENDLVFPSSVGTEQDASNVRRAFRAALANVPGIDSADWTPRELRHSFVSVLSDHGVPIEEISRLVGHSSTSVTETVYRHQLRPVIETGASAMDRIFLDDSTG